MASRELEVLLKIRDEASKEIEKFGGAVDGAGKKTESWNSSIKKLAVGATAIYAGKKLYDFAKESVNAFNEAVTTTERFAHILRTATGASDNQINALKAQAEALEQVGVVSARTILQGQGQLASFDLQAESIQKLIPSILNYAVAEKGLNMTTQDLQSVTNGLAQALNGKFQALTNTGFILDEETKAMISNGTETEKVTALVKVLDSTYAGLNEQLRQTPQGAVLGLSFAFNKLKEAVGGSLNDALMPFIAKLTELTTNPQFIEFVKALAQVIGVVLTGAIWVVWNAINGWIIIFEQLFSLAIEIHDYLKFVFGAVVDWLSDKILNLINKINEAVSAFKKLSVVQGASSAFNATTNWLSDRLVPFMAEGGVVTSPTLAMIGEAGPEAVIPLKKMGGMGGITVIVNGDVSGQELIDKVSNGLMRSLRLDSKLAF